jgi:protoporphyrinogen oxidase
MMATARSEVSVNESWKKASAKSPKSDSLPHALQLCITMTNRRSKDEYSEEEAENRVKAALRAAFSTPPKPQSEMKLGKPRAKPRKSPGKRKAVEKSER